MSPSQIDQGYDSQQSTMLLELAKTKTASIVSHKKSADAKVVAVLEEPEAPHEKELSRGKPYSVLQQPLGATRHLRIVTIGAGASGLNMIRTLRRNLTDFEHVVYEKNRDIGGTWYENRYPGMKFRAPNDLWKFFQLQHC